MYKNQFLSNRKGVLIGCTSFDNEKVSKRLFDRLGKSGVHPRVLIFLIPPSDNDCPVDIKHDIKHIFYIIKNQQCIFVHVHYVKICSMVT